MENGKKTRLEREGDNQTIDLYDQIVKFPLCEYTSSFIASIRNHIANRHFNTTVIQEGWIQCTHCEILLKKPIKFENIVIRWTVGSEPKGKINGEGNYSNKKSQTRDFKWRRNTLKRYKRTNTWEALSPRMEMTSSL